MYERFTDRARKVLVLANQEALHFNHETVDTYHILLGLVKEGSGVAANVLKNLDIDLRKIRLAVEKVVRPGPEQIIMGKLPHTPAFKKVIEGAIGEALTLGHRYVGTEHLLLALVKEGSGIAAMVLTGMGLKLETIRLEILNLLQAGAKEEVQQDKLRIPYELLYAYGRLEEILECKLVEMPPQVTLDTTKLLGELVEAYKAGSALSAVSYSITMQGKGSQESYLALQKEILARNANRNPNVGTEVIDQPTWFKWVRLAQGFSE